MLCNTAAVVTALLTFTALLATGAHAGFPDGNEPGKVLLFSIDAHSGKDPLQEFLRHASHDVVYQQGLVFRSSLLNNLPWAVRSESVWEIVAEMRKGDNEVVASATFDVTRDREKLNSENWFTKDRLIKSYPYWIGKGNYQSFSISGHSWGSFRRSFYIQFTHEGCPGDTGFMGIGDSARDGCQYVTNGVKGRPPVLFYSEKNNVPYAKSVKYADRFVVYMKRATKPYIFAPGKALLFTITAHSGKDALAEFRNTRADDSHPQGEVIPSLFRSSLLDNIPAAVRTYLFTRIVVEMRKGDNEVVASATFDVERDRTMLNSENWFTKDRLIKSYPYWIGKGNYQSFSISGHSWGSFRRSFYIQFMHEGCPGDTGFMGIGDSAQDGCQYVTNGVKGRPPVLFYSDQKKVPYSRNVKYADRFVIYFEG